MLISEVPWASRSPISATQSPVNDHPGFDGSSEVVPIGSGCALARRRDNGYRRFLPALPGLTPQPPGDGISGDAPVERNRPPRPVPMGAPVKRPCPGNIPSRRRHLY